MQTLTKTLGAANKPTNFPANGDFILIHSSTAPIIKVTAVGPEGTETVDVAVNDPTRFDSKYKNLSLQSSVGGDVVRFTYGTGWKWPLGVVSVNTPQPNLIGLQDPNGLTRPGQSWNSHELSVTDVAVTSQQVITVASGPTGSVEFAINNRKTAVFEVLGLTGGDTLTAEGLVLSSLLNTRHPLAIFDWTTKAPIKNNIITADGIYYCHVEGFNDFMILPEAGGLTGTDVTITADIVSHDVDNYTVPLKILDLPALVDSNFHNFQVIRPKGAKGCNVWLEGTADGAAVLTIGFQPINPVTQNPAPNYVYLIGPVAGALGVKGATLFSGVTTAYTADFTSFAYPPPEQFNIFVRDGNATVVTPDNVQVYLEWIY